MPQSVFDSMVEVGAMPRADRQTRVGYGIPLGGITRHFTRHNPSGFQGSSDRSGSDSPASFAVNPNPTERMVSRADAVPTAAYRTPADPEPEIPGYGNMLGMRFYETNSTWTGVKVGRAFPTDRGVPAGGGYGRPIEFRAVGGRDVPIVVRDCTDNAALTYPTTLAWDARMLGPLVYVPNPDPVLYPDGLGRRLPRDLAGVANYTDADETGVAMCQYPLAEAVALGVFWNDRGNQTTRNHVFRNREVVNNQGTTRRNDVVMHSERRFSCVNMDFYTATQNGAFGNRIITVDPFADAVLGSSQFLRNENVPPVAGLWAPDVYFVTQAWDLYEIDALQLNSAPAVVIMGYSQIWLFDGGTTAERNDVNSGKYHDTGELVEWCILRTCANGFPPNAANFMRFYAYKHAASINDLSGHFHRFFYMICPSAYDTVPRGNYSICPQFFRHCTIPGRNRQAEYIGDEIIWDPATDQSLLDDWYFADNEPNRTFPNHRVDARLMSRWKDGIPGGEVEFRNISFNFAVSKRDLADINSTDDRNDETKDWASEDIRYEIGSLPAGIGA
jgi:hypothetical protein